MTFQPGHTLSPGRRLGSRNKRTAEIFHRLETRGDIDPADRLSSIVTNPQEQQELRIQAAGLLMPYKYGKHGSIPPLRYIDEPIQLSEPTTIEQANKNIAYISNLKAQGLIDLDFANSLIADNTTIANNLIAEEELRFKINPPETHDQKIFIEGGLPALPGTSITMPQLNGHVADARALAAPTDVVPADDGTNQVPSEAVTEFRPGELKAQGPHPLQERHFRPDEPGKNSTNGGQEP
jgi:hypothetical protein